MRTQLAAARGDKGGMSEEVVQVTQIVVYEELETQAPGQIARSAVRWRGVPKKLHPVLEGHRIGVVKQAFRDVVEPEEVAAVRAEWERDSGHRVSLRWEVRVAEMGFAKGVITEGGETVARYEERSKAVGVAFFVLLPIAGFGLLALRLAGRTELSLLPQIILGLTAPALVASTLCGFFASRIVEGGVFPKPKDG